MRKVIVSLFFIALATALRASSQVQPKSLVRFTFANPKPGMEYLWTEGLKKLDEWPSQRNLPFALWTGVWNIVSGPRTGQFATGAFGLDWKDFVAAAKASHGWPRTGWAGVLPPIAFPRLKSNLL